jgi:hypothetical protein
MQGGKAVKAGNFEMLEVGDGLDSTSMCLTVEWAYERSRSISNL